uniref:Trypsin-like peptidase domain-containing protein n=1 Tax=Candidatus Kentrum sp. MB TaxID=2138164 RepID=A0A451BA82_9GAMM|nr:MAG: Trypsin-like peptidase domain-containing protein [Candidatus Kentron sp. MB]VFK30357.1 MAG: Trypsin-like peptidase domain-containing protein [Candidatus Kentron sp. MB]VFK75184.1 MAG: Trypsin-like peptidase domain-containing protein [Candidatus Kentron sp. MB]
MDDWMRAVVRVWDGNPFEDGIYLGTAFFIAPGYLLTAGHVLDNMKERDFENVFLHSDLGAWEGGGIRRIRKPLLYSKLDVAILPLERAAENPYCIPLAAPGFRLKRNQSVLLAGYSTSDGSIETPEVSISGYLGGYDLDVTHTSIGKGFSGGPVLFQEKFAGLKLAGLIRLRAEDGTKTYLIPLDAFRNSLPEHALSVQPIRAHELDELKELLCHVGIDDGAAQAYFQQTVPDSRRLDNCTNGKFFQCCLDFLAQKQHTPPDQAPLLTFLEYCRSHIPQECESKLSLWKQKIATHLGVDLEEIRAKIQQAEVSSATVDPVVLLKIEPDRLIKEDQFSITAWFYPNGERRSLKDAVPLYHPGDNPRPFSKRKLETGLRGILHQAVRGLSTPRLEIILPIALFDWNPGSIQFEVRRGMKRSLGRLYPIYIRSWDRIYSDNDDYDYAQNNWLKKRWIDIFVQKEHLHCLLNDQGDYETLDYEILFDNLDLTARVFLALCALPADYEHREALFGTVLAAGLPFIFWSIEAPSDPDALHRELEVWLCTHNTRQWPEKLLQRRKEQATWNDLMMLYDNPEHRPPDFDYAARAPDE